MMGTYSIGVALAQRKFPSKKLLLLKGTKKVSALPNKGSTSAKTDDWSEKSEAHPAYSTANLNFTPLILKVTPHLSSSDDHTATRDTIS